MFNCPRTLFRTLCVLLALIGLVAWSSGCDSKTKGGSESGAKEGGEEKKPKVDAFDDAKMKDGESYTLKLNYWMKGSGADATGNAMVDNLHFDAAELKRVVFWMGEGIPEKVAGLEQSKQYTVTFSYKAGKEIFKGTITKIE